MANNENIKKNAEVTEEVAEETTVTEQPAPKKRRTRKTTGENTPKEPAPAPKEALEFEEKKNSTLARLSGIYPIEGFYPETLLETFKVDQNTSVKKMLARHRIGWFRLFYPDGRIVVNVSPTKINGYYQAVAEVYKDSNPEAAPIAKATVVRHEEIKDADSPYQIDAIEWAQTAAITKALVYAGFRLPEEAVTDDEQVVQQILGIVEDGQPAPVVVHNTDKLKAAVDATAEEVESRRKRKTGKKDAPVVDETASGDAPVTDTESGASNAGAPDDDESVKEAGSAIIDSSDSSAHVNDLSASGVPAESSTPTDATTGSSAKGNDTSETDAEEEGEAPLNPTEEDAKAALKVVYTTSSKSLQDFNGKTFREILLFATPDKPTRGKDFVRWLAEKDLPFSDTARILIAFSANHQK